MRTALAILFSTLVIGASAPQSAAVPMTGDCRLTPGATHIKPNFAAYRVPIDKRPPVPMTPPPTRNARAHRSTNGATTGCVLSASYPAPGSVRMAIGPPTSQALPHSVLL